MISAAPAAIVATLRVRCPGWSRCGEERSGCEGEGVNGGAAVLPRDREWFERDVNINDSGVSNVEHQVPKPRAAEHPERSGGQSRDLSLAK
jgi:hypothetical protein